MDFDRCDESARAAIDAVLADVDPTGYNLQVEG